MADAWFVVEDGGPGADTCCDGAGRRTVGTYCNLLPRAERRGETARAWETLGGAVSAAVRAAHVAGKLATAAVVAGRLYRLYAAVAPML